MGMATGIDKTHKKTYIMKCIEDHGAEDLEVLRIYLIEAGIRM